MLNNNHNSKRRVSKSFYLGALFSVLFFLLAAPLTHAQEPDLIGGAVGILANIIYPLALGVGGLFLGIGGLALDFAFRELVVGMGELLNGGYGLGIIQVWQIIRDVFNIVFIFSFIFLGIKTILNADDSGTKRALGHLIIAALFINFSLLITQVIIDFSNVAATQMYNQIITGGTGGTGTSSLTGAFMEIVSMNSFFGDNSGGLQGMQLIVYSLLMMIFFILAGIIFLFGAYHVIYRFVALGIYMILSPVLFLGLILPNFKGYTDKWLKGLLRQSFFAPAFVFIIYVALLTLQRLKEALNLTSDIGYSVVMEGSKMTVNEFTIFIFFGVGLGFLYASVKVGDLMGISGASGVLNGINGAVKGARGSLQSLAYRNTAGRALNWGVGRIDALDQAAEKGSRGARFARTIMGGESTRKAVEKASNYGAGGMGRDAAEKQNKERSQRAARGSQISKINEAVKAGAGAGPGTNAQIALEQAVTGASTAHILEMLDEHKEGSKEYGAIVSNMSQDQFDSVMKEKPEVFNDGQKNALARARSKAVREKLVPPVPQGQPARTPAQEQAELIKALKEKATTDELLTLGFDVIRSNSQYIPASKMDDIIKNKKLTDTQKRLLGQERKDKIEQSSPADFAVIVAGQKAKDIAKLPKSLYTTPTGRAKMLPHLTAGVLEVIGSADGENMILDQGERSNLKQDIMAQPQGTVSPAIITYLNSTEGIRKFG